MTTEVWLVRHGPTEWSENGRHTGTTDLPLLAEGEAKALELQSRLAAQSFDLVLTSPLLRAKRTAELAGFEHAEVDQNLVEWVYGDYEGLTTETIREQVPGWELWTHPTPGGETPDQIGERLDAVVARVRSSGGRSLLFGHGHALKVLAARWLDLDPTYGRLFELGTASVSVLGYKRDLPVIEQWNA